MINVPITYVICLSVNCYVGKQIFNPTYFIGFANVYTFNTFRALNLKWFELGKKIYYQRTFSGSEIVHFILKADNKFEKNQWAGISLTTVTEHWTNCVRNKWKIYVIFLICVKYQLTVELRAGEVQLILYIIYIII